MSEIEVSTAGFAPDIVSRALMRAGYLYPSAEFVTVDEAVVRISDENAKCLGAELRYLLYREKISFETLDIRKALIGQLG